MTEDEKKKVQSFIDPETDDVISSYIETTMNIPIDKNFETLSPDTILEFIGTLNDSLVSKNTVTEQEFEQYRVLFVKEAVTALPAYEKERLVNQFNARFSLFDPIKVINTQGTVIFETSPSLITPSTFNDTQVSINQYEAALAMTTPLHPHKDIMTDAIVNTIRETRNPNVKKAILHRLAVESSSPEYELHHQLREDRGEGVEVDGDSGEDGPIKIDTKGMFD